jgi:hypothetical protein
MREYAGLLLENELIDEPKCISALMQIVMTLIVYQKTLSFT